MGKFGSILAPQTNLALMYAERLLKDVRADQFARLARPGGQMVQSNHPAFALGHLSLYPSRILAGLEQPASDHTIVPSKWEELFRAGAECRDDAEGTIYPPMDEITRRFFDGYRAALQALTDANDTVFEKPNPAEGRMRELFPTNGAMLCFSMGGHIQMHLGQISAWRRAMGMPSAM